MAGEKVLLVPVLLTAPAMISALLREMMKLSVSAMTEKLIFFFPVATLCSLRRRILRRVLSRTIVSYDVMLDIFSSLSGAHTQRGYPSTRPSDRSLTLIPLFCSCRGWRDELQVATIKLVLR